jgi:hypothetical protein
MDRVETPAIHQIGSMDFLADALFDGRRYRVLAVVEIALKNF